MADEKTSKMKGKWVLVVKLVAGLGALTGAVERYVDLQEKNELVYQALASKVNHMAEELSEIKGQNQVLMVFMARSHGMEDMLHDMPARAPASAPPEDEDEVPVSDEAGAEGAGEEAAEVFSGETTVSVEVASDEPSPKKEKRVVVQAYQELPANLDDLVQTQEQFQDE